MDPESSLDQLVQETRKSKAREPDLAMFDRLPVDSPQRNTEYLPVAIQNHIERQRIEHAKKMTLEQLNKAAFLGP